MSHIEEEFLKIEKERGWNKIFTVSLIYFIENNFINSVCFFRNLKMNILLKNWIKKLILHY